MTTGAGWPGGEISHLLGPTEASAHLVAAGLDVVAAQPDYVRHKPGESALVGYRIRTAEARETRAHIRWCADPDRAAGIHRKALSLRPRWTELGRSVARLDANTVLFTFPADASLRQLRWWVDPRKLKRSLESLGRDRGGLTSKTGVEILRYKPERRVVALLDLAPVDGSRIPLVVRYSTEAIDHRLHRIARALRNAGVGCPEPVAVRASGRVMIDRFVPGSTVADALRDGHADPFPLAAALSAFHATTPVPGLVARFPSADLQRATAGLNGLRALRPDLADLVEHLARTLTRTVPRDPASDDLRLVHGDLHPKNILIDDRPDRAGTPCFIDLERTALGVPAVDLGTLLGHAIATEVRHRDCWPSALDHAETAVEAYRSDEHRAGVDDRTVGWYTAAALVDQALVTVRQLEPHQGVGAELILESAVQLSTGYEHHKVER